MMSPGTVVILAAGDGRRMRSARAKPLHPVGRLPMLGHVLATARALDPQTISVVTAPAAEAVRTYVAETAPEARTCVQTEPRGTADALLAAEADIRAGETVVLYGDAPLAQPETLRAMSEARARCGAAAMFLGFHTDDPSGYGRIELRGDGTIEAITEARDASPDAAGPFLCNAGAFCADSARLLDAAREIPPAGNSGERYLTAIVPLLRDRGEDCRAHSGTAEEALGANTPAELAQVEAAFQARARIRALEAGAILQDPASVQFSHDTRLEAGATIGPFVVFGPAVQIAAEAEILPFSMLEGCDVGRGARIGPSARIRPGSRIREDARIGHFVEIKAAEIGARVRVGHLAYIGDAEIGADANIGAGVVTCNYDGVAKHRTEIGAGAFVGSNVSLVAPVQVGAGAYIGAGSVITRDVEADALALARAPQQERPGWAARLRRLRKSR